MSGEPSKASLLASEIRALMRCWLHVRCSQCPYSAGIPLAMDKLKGYRPWTLERFVARLKCSSCGAKPASVVAADHPIIDAKDTVGAVASWAVDVTSR